MKKTYQTPEMIQVLFAENEIFTGGLGFGDSGGATVWDFDSDFKI